MPLHRRDLLAATATTGSAALAGCVDGCGFGFPPGADLPHDGEIAVSAVESVPDGATVIDVAGLPDAERSLLDTALRSGVVRACMTDGGELADPLRSFARRTRQETYLAVGTDRYALWVRVTDLVYATTADPPAGDENPCC